MLTAIRNWVVRTMMKAKGETGIVKTLPKKEIVEINTQITAQRLMENGIDPRSLKNADQVENAIIAIENRPKVQQGITSTKSADVFDLKGKKIKDTDNIMGGEELPPGDPDLPPPGSRGGDDDIAAPFQSAEESIKDMIEAENKKNISKMRERKNREDVYGIEDYDTTNMSEIKQEIIKTETKLGNLNPDAPDFREKAKPLIDKITALQKKLRDDKATGGRAGFSNGSKGLLDILNIQAEGSKSGKQQIKGAPEGITIDSETYNVILNADIPINEKINLLTTYGRDKGRDKIEKDGQELFLGEGGSRIREIGLDINPDAEKGFGGNIMYDPDNNNVKGGITYKFADGGRAGFKTGLGKRFLDLIKGKPKKMFRSKDDVPTSVFSEKKGPITIEDMANISKDDLRKIRRTQELGLYDETPEILKAGNLFDRFTKKVGNKRVIDYDRAEIILNRKLRGDETLNELLQIEYQTRPGRAEGGIMRLGLKEGSGMTRRTFLKLLGGMAAIPIVGKFLAPMKVGKTITKVPMIKTDNIPGKPEWFDALVNKVIIEGDDVTKKFATAERQSIHQKTLDDGSVVRVTEDVDDGAVRVEYQSEKNVFGDDVMLQYKKSLPDEGDPNPSARFDVAESGPVGRVVGPDDVEIDIDEVGGQSIRDLDSDVSKLKEYATGKKLTMKEILESKKRRDKAAAITDDIDGAQSDAIVRRQGDYDPSDYDDGMASGGIARMLGE